MKITVYCLIKEKYLIRSFCSWDYRFPCKHQTTGNIITLILFVASMNWINWKSLLYNHQLFFFNPQRWTIIRIILVVLYDHKISRMHCSIYARYLYPVCDLIDLPFSSIIELKYLKHFEGFIQCPSISNLSYYYLCDN